MFENNFWTSWSKLLMGEKEELQEELELWQAQRNSLKVEQLSI